MTDTRYRRRGRHAPSAAGAAGLVLAMALAAGCGDPGAGDDGTAATAAAPAAPTPAAPVPAEVLPRLGDWRAVVTLPGGELPFTLRFAQSARGLSATVVNGDERVAVGEIRLDGDRLVLDFPAFNNRIAAAVGDDGRLRGDLTLVKRGGETQVMPFTAAPGAASRFTAAADPAVDVSGRWAVTFTDDDGDTTPAVGEFRQQGGEVQGTFLTPTGDYRYLAGNVDGDTLYLSTFDGAHAFLFSAKAGADGTLTGDFWSGTAWHEAWKARRDASAALPDPETLTFLKPGYAGFSFSFPDENGNPVSLDDARFQGKVVLVTLAGSWCPNCHDEAAYLAEYYREHRDQGVEVVCLMYEHFDDFEQAAAQVKRFRAKFDVGYTTLIAGVSDKTEAAKTLPMLNHVLAFPTTIFVDREGQIRKIHTGFAGPGTGEHFEAWERGFKAFMAELIAESGVQANRGG